MFAAITSLQQAPCIFLTLISSLILIKNIKKMDNHSFSLFIFIVGSLTCFFDFLTTPIFSLVCPILIYVLYQKRICETPKNNILSIINYSIVWGMSYSITWITKWITVDIVLHKDVVNSSLNQVLYRINGEFYKFSGNFKAVLTYIMVYTFFAISIILIAKVLSKIIQKNDTNNSKKNSVKDYLRNSGDLLFICLLPILWMIITSNHILVHPHFTIKNIFAIIFIIIYFSIIPKENLINKKQVQ